MLRRCCCSLRADCRLLLQIDSPSCIRPSASEAEDDESELGVFPEAAVVDAPDAEVAVFPRSDADAAAADAVAAAADAVA